MIKRYLLITGISHLLSAGPGAELQASNKRDAGKPQPERLADVQPHLRRATFQPAQGNQQTERRELRMVWTRGLGPGDTETIPLVHDGVMYTIAPGAIVQALDATTGDLSGNTSAKFPPTRPVRPAPKASPSIRTSSSTPRLTPSSDSTRAPANSAGIPRPTAARQHLRRHRRRRHDDHGRLLRGQARRLLHLRSRRYDRQRSLALPHHARQRRARRRKLERRRSR